MSADQIDIGIVGVGFIGELHARLQTEHPQTNLRTVIDLDKTRANEVADQFDVPNVYTDIDAALDEHELDAIVVATPESYHRDPTITALDRGVAVLLEKPIAKTVEDAQAIGKAANESSAQLMIAYVCRFHPKYAALKTRVDEGDLGEILAVTASRVANREIYEMAAEWSHPMYYLAVHDIDVMLWYVDANVESVTADASSGLGDVETPGAVSATLKFDSGAIGALETNWARSDEYPTIRTDEVSLTGRDGYAKLVMEPNRAKIAASSGFEYFDSPELHGRWTDMYRFQLDHFITTVNTDTEPLVTWEDGLRSLAVANAIVEATESGERIPLEAD